MCPCTCCRREETILRMGHKAPPNEGCIGLFACRNITRVKHRYIVKRKWEGASMGGSLSEAGGTCWPLSTSPCPFLACLLHFPAWGGGALRG